ncbi:MFS transporter [Tistrella mobilis]|uniref:MFS-type transporter ywfA n=1 Tax=Tistrella mobilis (strain KA081020-065) TaxID=1110502 RepID=I3TJP0_TISMK|nr:MFS transporter [Tistrella mobilis]AFK52978.1 MFS-type transporter ywfA [Tistrella mobilis KA081020-065]
MSSSCPPSPSPALAADMPAGLPGWAVAALIAAVAGIGTEAFAVAPLLIDIARDFDMAATDAAFAISAYGLAVAVSAPLFGLFAGHLPRRRLIAAGMVIATIAGIVAATAQSFGMLLAARMLSGLACGAVLPTIYAYVGDMVPFAARGRVMGRVMFGWAITMVTGVPLAGIAAEHLGWRGTLTAAALIILVLAVAVLRLPQPPARDAAGPAAGSGHDAASFLARLRHAVTRPGVAALLATNLANMVSFYGIYAYIGTALRNLEGSGAAAAGAIVLWYGVGLAGSTLNARLVDRVGKDRALTVALAFLAVDMVAMSQSLGRPVAFEATLILWGLAQGTVVTALNTLATERAGTARGLVMALMSAVTYLGISTGTAVLGLVMAAHGFVAVGLTAATISLAGVAAARISARRGRIGG